MLQRIIPLLLTAAAITVPLSVSATTAKHAAVTSGHTLDTGYRLVFDPTSTSTKPSYFACIVTPSQQHPTLKKWTPPLEFTDVYLVNYAQNVQGFNGLGILKTTAGYLNSHYFRSYHDSDFSQKVAGFIDAFVLWAGYQIQCFDITAQAKNLQYTGEMTVTHQQQPYTLTLAGSDYN